MDSFWLSTWLPLVGSEFRVQSSLGYKVGVRDKSARFFSDGHYRIKKRRQMRGICLHWQWLLRLSNWLNQEHFSLGSPRFPARSLVMFGLIQDDWLTLFRSIPVTVKCGSGRHLSISMGHSNVWDILTDAIIGKWLLGWKTLSLHFFRRRRLCMTFSGQSSSSVDTD